MSAERNHTHDNEQQTACIYSTEKPNNVAFISGPIDTGPGEEYFHTFYVPCIDSAIACDDHFVIGPIPQGVDADALKYLLAQSISPQRITIFVTPSEDGWWGEKFRGLGVNVHVIDGQMGAERDAALTRASTYDILRIRTEREAKKFYGSLWREGHVTNTERNWKRRRGISEYEVMSIEEINRTMGFSSNSVCEEEQEVKPGCFTRWLKSGRGK